MSDPSVLTFASLPEVWKTHQDELSLDQAVELSEEIKLERFLEEDKLKREVSFWQTTI
jgi:hypothetical protein